MKSPYRNQFRRCCLLLLAALAGPAAFGQGSVTKPPQQQQQQQQPPPVTKAPGTPGQTAPPPTAPPPTAPPPTALPPTAPGQAAPAQTAPAQPAQSLPAAAGPAPVTGFDYMIPNASLTEFIDIMARRLRINYILDPAVSRGSVTLYTYGEVKPVDLMTLLLTVLRVNGATMVQVGDLYRIVPINKISSLPMTPMTDADPKTLPEDERMILDLIFLKYTTAKEIETLITPFLGEGASHSTYDPANLLILQDNARSMKRTMQLIEMFDSDTLAGQRVRLFDITNSRPSDLVKDLETVFKAFALSDKGSAAVKFVPVDRINMVIAVAPNPGIFAEVKKWIDKFDVPVKITPGQTGNYVYRLKYARAEMIAMAIMALYTGNIGALVNMAQQMNSNMFAAGIGMSGGGYGTMNGGMNGYGSGGFGMNGGMNGYGGMNGGMNAYGGSGYGGFSGGGYSGAGLMNQGGGLFSQGTAASGSSASVAARDQTGNFLGSTGQAGGATPNMPHVVPNPFDNTLIIQGSAQEIEQIKDLLRQLDVAPRQILIDAKIYEVDLTGAFSAGVSSYLQSTGTITGYSNGVTASGGAAGAVLTLGEVVLHSKQLFAALNLQENKGRTRVVSAPSIIATDSVPATMNVGDQVPVETSQAAVGGVSVGGTTPFANTIGSASTGVTFSILARANSSGIVTMVIDQQVSAPEPPPIGVSSGVQSSSFSNRSVSTQITVQDGDTVAIGGIIMEKYAESKGGIPLLYKIPILGQLFGSKSITSSRTELIIFLTPRVIYDTSQMSDATDEIRNGLKSINKVMKANKDDQ